jgi:hypothetical protein
MNNLLYVDPEAARNAQNVLVEWLRMDVDPQATPVIIGEIRNVGGVYKESLRPHMNVIRDHTSYGDSKVSEVATAIVTYFDGSEAYLAETFLRNQVEPCT